MSTNRALRLAGNLAAMNVALALTLLPALAFGASGSNVKPIAALLIAGDAEADAKIPRIAAAIESGVRTFSGVSVKTHDTLFGMPTPAAAEPALRRADLIYAEGRQLFEAKKWPEADRKLAACIKEYSAAAVLLKKCGNLCDAIAMLAASHNARGDVDEARIQLMDLVSLDIGFELDRKRFTQDFIALRSQVVGGRAAQLRSTVKIKSKPIGAKVFIDGAEAGLSPVAPPLAIGKHMLRIERPGYQRFGSVFEVTTDDAELTFELVPTEPFKKFIAQRDALANEARTGHGGKVMAALGNTFGLERAFVGLLKTDRDSDATELSIGLFETKTGRKISARKVRLEEDEYGQLNAEIERLVNTLMNAEFSSSGPIKSDPLDREGLEDWSAEDRGGKRTIKEKKKPSTDDPLDRRSGTEDW